MRYLALLLVLGLTAWIALPFAPSSPQLPSKNEARTGGETETEAADSESTGEDSRRRSEPAADLPPLQSFDAEDKPLPASPRDGLIVVFQRSDGTPLGNHLIRVK